jgi:DNA polymerase-3 subunit beta
MKFIVSTSQLLKHLQLISGVISSNTVLPILEDFLFDIKKGKMVIYATDLENSMSTELDIESKEDGRIAIPAKILIDTLKAVFDRFFCFLNKMDKTTSKCCPFFVSTIQKTITAIVLI